MTDYNNDEATKVLSLAQKLHDDYIRQGKEKAERIVMDAQIDAHKILRDAKDKARVMVEDAETERKLLVGNLVRLQNFEAEYQEKLSTLVNVEIRGLLDYGVQVIDNVLVRNEEEADENDNLDSEYYSETELDEETLEVADDTAEEVSDALGIDYSGVQEVIFEEAIVTNSLPPTEIGEEDTASADYEEISEDTVIDNEDDSESSFTIIQDDEDLSDDDLDSSDTGDEISSFIEEALQEELDLPGINAVEVEEEVEEDVEE